MKLSDFDYDLPKNLIAQYPLKQRDHSQLLVLDRTNDKIIHRKFHEIFEFFNPGDLLILNDTKVFLARLFGHKKNTGGKIEVLLLEKLDDVRFRTLINPLSRLKIDEEVAINNNGLSFKLVDFKNRIIEFNQPNILEKLDKIGHVPLPQYIKRKDSVLDRSRYQTVYAKNDGAVAAPTAGLHFTLSLLRKIKQKKVKITYVTLHVGYGTFAPIREEKIASHKMAKEYFQIPKDTVNLIKEAKSNHRKVFAVGTTTCRALEANKEAILNNAKEHDLKGCTDLFIYPSYKFQIVDSLITNFHLPKSTLYLLVCAFAGLENVRKAYSAAIEKQYRFYSYGDAMLAL